LVNPILRPYFFTDPLPNPLVANGASGSTWEIWITVSVPAAQLVTYQFVYALTNSSAAFSICATGTFYAVSTPIAGSSPTQYYVLGVSGTRTFTNASGSFPQQIIGLAQPNTDGNDLRLSPASPFVDGAGITYALSGPAIYGPGDPGIQPADGSLGLAEFAMFINLYNNSNTIAEDNGGGNLNTPVGPGILLSAPNANTPYTCAALQAAAGSSSSAAPAVPSSSAAAASSSSSAAAIPSSSSAAVLSSSAPAQSSSTVMSSVMSSTSAAPSSTSLPTPTSAAVPSSSSAPMVPSSTSAFQTIAASSPATSLPVAPATSATSTVYSTAVSPAVLSSSSSSQTPTRISAAGSLLLQQQTHAVMLAAACAVTAVLLLV
jgi:hypothetical protein